MFPIIKNTEANREKLAQEIVDNMELKDMIQAIYEQEIECFEKCDDTFQEQWDNNFGD